MFNRNIVATFTRKNKVLETRRYSRIDTAYPRVTQLLILDGQPRDVVEFSHAETGLHIGHVKLHTGGKLSAEWIWND